MSTRLFAVLFTLIVGAAMPAAAQPAAADSGTHGHFFFFAAGMRPPGTHLGGGGEAAIGRFGLATEFGGIPHTSHGTITTLSAFGAYHFLGQHPAHADPFLTAGYSGLFADSKQHENGVAASAGLNWWFGPRRGYHPGLGVEYKVSAGASYRELRVSVRLWQ